MKIRFLCIASLLVLYWFDGGDAQQVAEPNAEDTFVQDFSGDQSLAIATLCDQDNPVVSAKRECRSPKLDLALTPPTGPVE